MAAAARTGRSTRRDFMRLAGLGGGAAVLTAGSWGRRARAQALKSITASHSVSTFVYGQHPAGQTLRLDSPAWQSNKPRIWYGVRRVGAAESRAIAAAY